MKGWKEGMEGRKKDLRRLCSTSAMPTMSLERRYAMLLKKDGHKDQDGGGPITKEPCITCRAWDGIV